MNRLLPLLLVLPLAACGFADAEQSHAPPAAQSAPATATRVEVAELQPSNATIDITVPGEVEGWHDALLASSLGGRVEAVAVHNGDDVRKGQILARVDAQTYAAQVEQAQAQLEQAQADLKRVQALGDMASQADLDRAGTQAKVAQAGLDLARAQLDKAVIRAPFAGRVSGVDIEIGEFAAPGSPVLRLAELDPVKVKLSVPDRDVVALKDGMPVEITASARSGVFPGTIRHVGTAADLKTRAFPVEVEVPNADHQLLPGMIVRVTASRTLDENTVVIPQEWVITRLSDQGVFVVQDGKAAWRPVTLGNIVRDQVVVTGGLQMGDKVVITGHRDLAQGDDVLVSREATCCTNGRAVFGATGEAE